MNLYVHNVLQKIGYTNATFNLENNFDDCHR